MADSGIGLTTLVFGSFNQVPKITDACVEHWSEIMRRVPHAELVILDFSRTRPQRCCSDRFARALGVDAARVTTRGREDILSYFNAIGNVDIALDTMPYNGATTTLDTLWMGTPLIALRGETGIARGGFSILSTLGLPELIAETPAAYVEANVRLAMDAHRLGTESPEGVVARPPDGGVAARGQRGRSSPTSKPATARCGDSGATSSCADCVAASPESTPRQEKRLMKPLRDSPAM